MIININRRERYTLYYNQNTEEVLNKIICHCGPTLEGIKVSSLVNFKTYHEAWKNCKIEVKNNLAICFFELKATQRNTLVLFYNPFLLQDALFNENHQRFLSKFGYEDFNIDSALNHLRARFESACPHEIGIFLGYPLGDVECFSTRSNEPCLAVGYWKVYSDLDGASEIFRLYDSIKNKHREKLSEGVLPSVVLNEIKLQGENYENNNFIWEYNRHN